MLKEWIGLQLFLMAHYHQLGDLVQLAQIIPDLIEAGNALKTYRLQRGKLGKLGNHRQLSAPINLNHELCVILFKP